jgi:hypothetical protein
MSLFHDSALVGASGQAGGAGYSISRSLRFNAADSSFLSRTPASAGNRRKWTLAFWCKRSGTGTQQILRFGSGTSDSTIFDVYFYSAGGDNLSISGYATDFLRTTQVFRDFSAWYHIVITADTDNATASDRLRLYVNGARVTSFALANYPTGDLATNNTQVHWIGQGGSSYFSGYLADCFLIDSQALDPTAFGEFSATTGVWVPKAYSGGSYGSQGWHLDFADNSAATAAALGKDTSGNGNNWLPNNLSIITGGPTSVASASGALPVYNTTDTYGAIKGTGVRTDANASSLVLAIPMDGANNGTTFTDESATIRGSGSAKTITPTGNAKTSTTTSKFYGSSGSFDGTGDYLSLASSADFSFGTGDFTIEWYQYWNAVGYFGTLYDTNYAGTPGLVIQSGPTGTYTIIGGSALSFSSSTAPTLAVWTHYALVRSGSTVTLYRNGIADGSGTATGSIGNSTTTAYIAGSPSGGGYYVNAYIQDFRIYKGVAKYTSNFNPPSSTQNATLAAGNDSLVDVPTNGSEVDTGLGGQVRGNYCTWNPLAKTAATTTLSNGNLEATGDRNSYATFAIPSSGKWYWEITPTAGSYPMIGVAAYVSTSGASYVDTSLFYYGVTGQKYNAGSNSAYGSSYTSNDVIGVAVNADSGTVEFYKNGSSQGSITYAASGLFPATTTAGGSATYTANFGQRPFAYTAPSGFKALCTANLPVVVTKANEVFDVALYTGNGGTQAITLPGGMSPDLVWIKGRSSGDTHRLYDVIRGTTKALYSNITASEGTYQSDYENFTAFNSDGFSLGAATIDNGINKNATTYAAWCWDAGNTTVTNTQGSITSQVRANASAGFSIVTYTGNATAGTTVGHGLGVAPSMIIFKNRDAGTVNWLVYHSSLGATGGIPLNTTDAFTTNNNWLNSTSPSSSVFTVGVGQVANGSGEKLVAYCFAPVVGYSSFGSYTGNGSADGPFVYTGFRPRWILFRRTDAAANWIVWDTARDTYNSATNALIPSTSGAELTFDFGDILSSGFKVRTTAVTMNASAGTYIYAAFAESPFAANNRAR